MTITMQKAITRHTTNDRTWRPCATCSSRPANNWYGAWKLLVDTFLCQRAFISTDFWFNGSFNLYFRPDEQIQTLGHWGP